MTENTYLCCIETTPSHSISSKPPALPCRPPVLRYLSHRTQTLRQSRQRSHTPSLLRHPPPAPQLPAASAPRATSTYLLRQSEALEEQLVLVHGDVPAGVIVHRLRVREIQSHTAGSAVRYPTQPCRRASWVSRDSSEPCDGWVSDTTHIHSCADRPVGIPRCSWTGDAEWRCKVS